MLSYLRAIRLDALVAPASCRRFAFWQRELVPSTAEESPDWRVWFQN